MLSLPQPWQIELALAQAGDRCVAWFFGVGKPAGDKKGGGKWGLLLALGGLCYLGYQGGVLEGLIATLPNSKTKFVRGSDLPFTDSGSPGSGADYEVTSDEEGGPPQFRSTRNQSAVEGETVAIAKTSHGGGGDYSGPADFMASKALLKKIYSDHRIDEYCGCEYDSSMRLVNCGIETTSFEARAKKIEWEHIIPASDFGRQLSCWQDPPADVSGRTNCRDNDESFRRLEADPYNLMPVSGALNAIRSNFRYGEVQGEEREYGSCDFETSRGEGRFVEPPEWIKGDVARTYFYFERVHGFKIGRTQRQLFEAWDRKDPVSQWEIRRALRIYEATKMNNPIMVERIQALKDSATVAESAQGAE